MTDQKELLPTPQYVAIRFNEWDSRSYTYENPHKPVKVGDIVRVNGRGKITAVKVVGIVDTPAEIRLQTIGMEWGC